LCQEAHGPLYMRLAVTWYSQALITLACRSSALLSAAEDASQSVIYLLITRVKTRTNKAKV